MKLLEKIRIQNFRSIKDQTIVDLGSFTSFAGLNNSGKSNVLRALNLFFNNELEPNLPLNLDTDFFLPAKKSKKKKEITITITFALPNNFKFRSGLEDSKEHLGSKNFSIGKQWIRGKLVPQYFLNGKMQNPNGVAVIDQFLQLIRFRYIPNRVLPLDAIRSEHAALRDVFIRRLAQKKIANESVFEQMAKSASNVLNTLSTRFKDTVPGIGDVKLITPQSWADFVFGFGYRLSKDDIEIDDSSQGSGIQSLLMIETLYLIDQDYFQQFGWKQASIWALEEPESSLHMSLEAKMAHSLSGMTKGDSRLQILCTTHSDLMMQYSEKVFLASKLEWETQLSGFPSIQSAISSLASQGVTRSTHPLLFMPLDTLVLVEGKYDCDFIKAAFSVLKPGKKINVTYLEILNPGTGSTGGSDLLPYLKAHAATISNRIEGAKVIVVLDWDARRDKAKYERVVIDDARYQVLDWPDSSFNPNLGPNFRGVERCFSDSIIKRAIDRGAEIDITTNGKFTLQDIGKYNSNIKKVINEVIIEGISIDDLVHAKGFLDTLVERA